MPSAWSAPAPWCRSWLDQNPPHRAPEGAGSLLVSFRLRSILPQRHRQSLRFWESAFEKEFTELFLHKRTFGRLPSPGLRRGLLATVSQELAEAERSDDSRHPATAHRGVDLTGEHPRRGSRDCDLDDFRVQHPAHEGLPAGNELDFVEEPLYRLAPAQRRVATKVLFEDEAQLIHPNAGKPIIIEAEIEPRSGGRTARRSCNNWRRNVVLPARRMLITACTLPGTAGSRTSRRVSTSGGAGARAALSFSARTGCRVTTRGSAQCVLLSGTHSSESGLFSGSPYRSPEQRPPRLSAWRP